MADLSKLLDFAHRLADVARGETLRFWAEGCAAEDKGGAGYDPVTEADRAAERAMRALIEAEYPHHGISGEEYGERAGSGTLSWSLDPIDGTRSFICGLPSWTTLIALLEGDRPVLGIIDAPALDERYAGIGDQALASGTREWALRTSRCERLNEARLSTTDPYLFSGPELKAFERVRERARTTRYGQDAYGYARLAAGSLDLIIESSLKPHDYNALIPVVRAAGGAIGNWEGEGDFAGGRVVAAASKALFDEAVALLRA